MGRTLDDVIPIGETDGGITVYVSVFYEIDKLSILKRMRIYVGNDEQPNGSRLNLTVKNTG